MFQLKNPTNSKCRIVIREDLNMPEGKFAAQVGHGIDSIWMDFTVAMTSIRGANAAGTEVSEKDNKNVEDFTEWLNSGRRKIILRTKTEDSLKNLYEKVKAEGYNPRYIYDYAFNHFDEMTCTGFVVNPTSDDIKALKRVQLWSN